jgi:hypothetical protein
VAVFSRRGLPSAAFAAEGNAAGGFLTMEKTSPSHPTIQPIPLQPGRHYTIYAVSESAMTIRKEIRLIEALSAPEFRPAYVHATKGKWRLGTFKEGRKRTIFHLDLDAAGTLIIPGILHGVPADHEKWSSFAMSATLNLAATAEKIREMVELNINPNFTGHDHLVAYPTPLNHATGDTGILVYPDAPTTHAGILRMREALAKEDA